MKGLTAKEEEIMGFFWEKGPMFVKQLVELYEEPRPHFNTLSTIVRGLEEKGYLSHTAFGNTYLPVSCYSVGRGIPAENSAWGHLQIFQQLFFRCCFLAGERGRHFSGRTQRTHPSGGRGAERETTITQFCLWEPF